MTNKTILMIDPEMMALTMSKVLFNKAGYGFHSAKTGESGIEAACRERPDLIITENILPDMDGIAFLNKLKEVLPKPPPVVLLTSQKISEKEQEPFFEAGFSALLDKPFRYKEFVNVVKNLFLLAEAHEKNAALQSKIFEQEKNLAMLELVKGVNDKVINRLGTATMFCDMVPMFDDSENQETMAEIKKSVDESIKVIEDLRSGFDFSSDEAQELDIHQVIKSVMDRFTEVKFQYDSENSLPSIQSTGKLEPCVKRIVENSFEAGGKGVEVAISVDHDSTGENFRITISDNGPGMTEEILHKALTPFFSTRGQERLGLGIWYVNKFAESQGGKVAVQSQEGKGTTVVISLPVRQAGGK
jgi:signal transduction histidine kinase